MAMTKLEEQLLEALKQARQYVYGAYECAFPDEGENQAVLADVDAAIQAGESAK